MRFALILAVLALLGFAGRQPVLLADEVGTRPAEILPMIGPADGAVETVEAYLRRTKGWVAGDYRLEPAGVTPDGCCDIVRVVHRLDERGIQPGAGLSVELLLDRQTHGIKQERGLQ